MFINNRLKKVGDLVDTNSSFLDVGCDHAFLDIYLARKKDKTFSKIVASDNKQGPLDQAKKNITTYQLQQKIELRLGNGLDVYTNDIDTVIISGMGGRNMIGIIKEHLEYLKTIKTFILSPNNYQSDVKKFLVQKGYKIEDEYLVKEGKIIYQIIKFIKKKSKYTKKEYFFGPILLTKKNDLFNEYYYKELKSREILLQLLPKNYYLKKIKLQKEIKLIKSELKENV